MKDASGRHGLNGQIVHSGVTSDRELELANVYHRRVTEAVSKSRTVCGKTAAVKLSASRTLIYFSVYRPRKIVCR